MDTFRLNILGVKQGLKARFPFLRGAKNPVGYILSGERNQLKSHKQITAYMAWCNEEILKDYFKKYDLKLGKIELIVVEFRIQTKTKLYGNLRKSQRET